jgi:hypothetical protein
MVYCILYSSYYIIKLGNLGIRAQTINRTEGSSSIFYISLNIWNNYNFPVIIMSGVKFVRYRSPVYVKQKLAQSAPPNFRFSCATGTAKYTCLLGLKSLTTSCHLAPQISGTCRISELAIIIAGWSWRRMYNWLVAPISFPSLNMSQYHEECRLILLWKIHYFEEPVSPWIHGMWGAWLPQTVSSNARTACCSFSNL